MHDRARFFFGKNMPQKLEKSVKNENEIEFFKLTEKFDI